jgi:large conductance mechanosensitive channel
MLSEFKKFAMRGNVMDMAIGIILGGAFGKIVASAVSDLIMPPIGVLLGGVDFKDLAFTLKQPVIEAGGKVAAEAVQIRYGAFLSTVIDFLIIAFTIFVVIKALNSMKKPEAEPEPSEKKCEFCCTTIPVAASRCPHCTSTLEAASA